MYETALWLHHAGVISKRRMSEFDDLPPLMSMKCPAENQILREQSHVSQAVLLLF